MSIAHVPLGAKQVETGFCRARTGSSSVYLKLLQAGQHGRQFEQELANRRRRSVELFVAPPPLLACNHL